MQFDFTANEWKSVTEKACFSMEQLQIIQLFKKYGNTWTQDRYAQELNISLRTFQRKWKQIKRKIFLSI